MILFIELQNRIYELGEQIKAPKQLLRIYNAPQSDGTPYVLIFPDIYWYIIEERGCEFERNSTTDLDVLCYWIMERVVTILSMNYEVENRVKGKDYRRVMFEKRIELMGGISLNWKKIMEDKIFNILKFSPYEDHV